MIKINLRLYSAFLVILAISGTVVHAGAPDRFGDLFEERLASIVAVEFYVETETDRRPASEVGLVADTEGLIILLENSIPNWLPVSRLKEFRVFQLRTREAFSADYLGQDPLTGWHFIRVEEKMRSLLKPITGYSVESPAAGDFLWGIGVMGKDFDHEAYFLSGRLSVVQKTPQRMGFSTSELASPGSAIFSANGSFVGWAANPFTAERVLYIGGERYNVGVQSVHESGSFLLADEILPYLTRAPESPDRVVIPWLGVTGLQPVDAEVARFLGLEERSAVVVSDVISGSPADEAGLRARDVVVSVNGHHLPRFVPSGVVTAFFQREILRHAPGAAFEMRVLRGEDALDIRAVLGAAPKTVREAERVYFSGIGLTFREFVLQDGINHRLAPGEQGGVVVSFVRPNSPADAAGLQAGDFIREIGGAEVEEFATAKTALEAAKDGARREIVLLTSRNGETSVVRIRLR